MSRWKGGELINILVEIERGSGLKAKPENGRTSEKRENY
jgi:hypothetical protein